MDIVTESVKKIEGMVDNCGCEEGDVILDTNPDKVNCQYEWGACMVASFGGKTAEFVTDNPIRARTRLEFMFGAPLDTPQARVAAGSVINVLSAFFSLTRIHHACPAPSHMPCIELLVREIGGKRIKCTGKMPAIEAELRAYLVDTPGDADILLFNGEGLIERGSGDLIAAYRDSKRIICLGPSTSGIARLHGLEHWCPFGT